MTEQRQLAYELHRPKRKTFPTRPVEVKGLHELWQADLVEMGHLKKWNGGVNFLLTVIDAFSKQAFVEACKTKTGQDVTAAMKRILIRAKYSPKLMQTDMGKEFLNRSFAALMREYDIHHYHTYSPLKASIVERFNRTLKTIMYRHFTEQNTLNWVKAVQIMVSEYNNSVHRTIQMKPIKVNKKNEKRVLQNIKRSQRQRIKGSQVMRIRFNVGDFVRLGRYKNIFAKGYTPNWTEEIFKVSEIMSTRPPVYKVVDLLNTPIKGTFYAQELQQTKIPHYGRIEKVLKRKTLPDGTKMIRVQWKNHDSRFNQWIPLSSSMKL